MGVRWFDPELGRFTQPDTDVPESQGVQAFDRYAYVNNSPLRYSDPLGHSVLDVVQSSKYPCKVCTFPTTKGDNLLLYFRFKLDQYVQKRFNFVTEDLYDIFGLSNPDNETDLANRIIKVMGKKVAGSLVSFLLDIPFAGPIFMLGPLAEVYGKWQEMKREIDTLESILKFIEGCGTSNDFVMTFLYNEEKDVYSLKICDVSYPDRYCPTWILDQAFADDIADDFEDDFNDNFQDGFNGPPLKISVPKDWD